MKTLSMLAIATMIALGSFGQIAAADDPEPMQHGGGHGKGGGERECKMHEMMEQHMMSMREHWTGEHKGYAEVVLRHTEALKLSDEQIGKITRIHRENQEKIESIGKKLHESMKAAHEAFLNPSSDEATIRKTAQEHTAAFNELLETALKSRNAINALLTPEQLQKLKSLKEQKEEH